MPAPCSNSYDLCLEDPLFGKPDYILSCGLSVIFLSGLEFLFLFVFVLARNLILRLLLFRGSRPLHSSLCHRLVFCFWGFEKRPSVYLQPLEKKARCPLLL